MDTISYHGPNEKNNVMFGELALRWHEFKNKNYNGIMVPFFYTILHDNIQVDANRILFPICIRVSSGNNLNVPNHLIRTRLEFDAFIKHVKAAHSEFSLIITKPKLSHPNNRSATWPGKDLESCLYLGDDFLIYQDRFVKDLKTREETYTFPINLGTLTRLGLPANCVYKFSQTGNWWVFDGVYSRDNSGVDKIIGSNPLAVSQEKLNNFCLGFKNGYLNDVYIDHFHQIHNIIATFGAPVNFMISEDDKTAIRQGYILGRSFNFKSKHGQKQLFEQITNGNYSSNHNLKSEINNYNSSADLVNAIFSSDTSKIRESLKGYFENIYSPVPPDFSFANAINLLKYLKSDYERCYQSYNLIQPIDKEVSLSKINGNFTTRTSYSISGAKFRILERNDDNSIRVRLQVTSATKQTEIIFDDGKTLTASPSGRSNLEVDRNFVLSSSDFSKIDDLTFNLISNAGTSQLYAPVEILGDKIVATQNQLVLCDASQILSWIWPDSNFQNNSESDDEDHDEDHDEDC